MLNDAEIKNKSIGEAVRYRIGHRPSEMQVCRINYEAEIHLKSNGLDISTLSWEMKGPRYRVKSWYMNLLLRCWDAVMEAFSNKWLLPSTPLN